MVRSKFTLNPIIVKEVRSRMRGWRAFGILTLYLIFLALFSYGVYRVTLTSYSYGGGIPLSPLIGQSMFIAVANLTLFFVAFLVPALTSGAISSENEKLTLEMLQATPLNTHTILLGKLISATGYILLLLFAAIPMMSLIFIFGGIAPVDIFQAALVILMTAFTYGIIGLFFSAWRKRTMQAIALSYLTIILLVGGTFALYLFWGILIRDLPPHFILTLNPFSALASIFSKEGFQNTPLGVFGFLAGNPFDQNNLTSQLKPLWYYTTAIYLALSAVLYLVATRLIKPIRPWRIGWRGAAAVLVLCLLYCGLTSRLFYSDAVAVRDWRINGTPTPAMFPARIEPALSIEEAVPVPSEAEEAPDEEIEIDETE